MSKYLSDEELVKLIIQKATEVRARECERYNISVFEIELDTTLRGGTAGQAVISKESYKLRVNLELARRNLHDFLEQTVPHELAHILDYAIHGSISHHGYNWKMIMINMGLEPKRCHNYDTTGVKRRMPRPHKWMCECGSEFDVTERMHKTLLKGNHRHCKGLKLTYTGKSELL